MAININHPTNTIQTNDGEDLKISSPSLDINSLKINSELVIDSDGNFLGLNLSGGSAITEISTTEPQNPTDGQLWFNPTDSSLKIYYNNDWADVVTDSSGSGYTGSRGSLGYTGSRGIQGPAGAGYTGSRGITGFVGSIGSLGYTGSKGAGYTGSRGLNGFIGSTGSLGYTGSRGISGYTGSRGITGFVGSRGIIGFIGSRGLIGYTGSQGELGYTGSQGIVGFTGSRGDDGTITETLSIPPVNSVNGQMWFDTEDGTLKVYYEDGDSGQWVVVSGPIGPQGDLGYTGSIGYTGSKGAGYTGSRGLNGFIGSTGSLGYTGSSGISGYTGSIGQVYNWIIKTETDDGYISQNKDGIIADTTASSFTINLPSSPNVGDFIMIADGGNWSSNPLTVGRNGNQIENIINDDLLLDIGQSKAEFIYDGSKWQVITNVGPIGYTGSAASGGRGFSVAMGIIFG